MEVLRTSGDQVAIIELDGPVFFGSTDALAQAVDVLVARGSKYIVLDLKRIKGVDVSGTRALVQTYMQMRRQDVTMIFSYLYPGTESDPISTTSGCWRVSRQSISLWIPTRPWSIVKSAAFETQHQPRS